jgi:hypothetical protein
VPDFREGASGRGPHLSHTTSVLVDGVDSHYERGAGSWRHRARRAEGSPWGLRTYAAVGLEGYQWEFGRGVEAVEPEESFNARLLHTSCA